MKTDRPYRKALPSLRPSPSSVDPNVVAVSVEGIEDWEQKVLG